MLKMIRPKTVENLFFREAVGDLSVNSLLQDMFNADKVTLNPPTPVVATGSTEV
jgi:hypothetical protein